MQRKILICLNVKKSQRYDGKTLFLLMWPPVISTLILLMLRQCEKGVACLAFSLFFSFCSVRVWFFPPLEVEGEELA